MAKKESFGEIAFKLYILLVFVIVFPLYLKNVTVALIIFFVAAFLPLVVYVIYKTKKKRSFFESRKTLEDLRKLKPDEFEEFIAHLFRKMGYKTKKVGGAYDGGIDVIAEKDGVKHYIQCKKFITSQVSVGAIRDFYGALTDKMANAKGIFITTNIFTLDAEQFAEGKPLELIDGQKLMQYVQQAGGAEIPEKKDDACPHCGGALVERAGKYGKFMGCKNYPECKYTKSL